MKKRRKMPSHADYCQDACIRELAKTGQYSRRDLARICGVRYDRICDVLIGMELPEAKHDGSAGSVFEYLLRHKHDDDYQPRAVGDFMATGARPGTAEKVEVLADRVQRGLPLWHPQDFHTGGSGSFVGVDGPGIAFCNVPRMQKRNE